MASYGRIYKIGYRTQARCPQGHPVEIHYHGMSSGVPREVLCRACEAAYPVDGLRDVSSRECQRLPWLSAVSDVDRYDCGSL